MKSGQFLLVITNLVNDDMEILHTQWSYTGDD